MTALQFDEATHTYRVGSRVLPSVTQIIKPLYAGMFDFVTAEHLEWKSELGKAVHRACELDDEGTLDDSSMDELTHGYVRGWRKFRAENHCKVLLNEKPLHSAVMGFAGTVDCVVCLPSGKYVLIDRKTTATLSPVIGVQLAGYQMLVHERFRDAKLEPLFATMERWAVQLTDDGNYHIKRYDDPDDKRAFLACLSLNHWSAKHARK